MYYILDSNIWIDLAQGKLACADLIRKPTAKVVLAPLMIVEVVRGIIKGGERYFLQNRAMIGCMAQISRFSCMLFLSVRGFSDSTQDRTATRD